MQLFKIEIPKALIYFWISGLMLRLIGINLASIFPVLVPDFVFYRLPIAECLLSKNILYCDCTYNHTPLYPYLSTFMLYLAGDIEFLKVFFY